MTNEQVYLLLVFLLPLVGAVVNGFFLRRAPVGLITAVATSAILIPFVLSLILVFGPIRTGAAVNLELFPWMVLSQVTESDFRIPMALTADRLSGLLLLVVTGVGSLIHLYSGEYMSHEKGVHRFFAYLNLFVFAMLALILGSNMLTTFLGWEGVGLCSYLLIGYWYEEEKNAAAGMKAFIVNRIGDFGFLMAMFLSLRLFGTLGYSDLATQTAMQSAAWFQAHSLELTLLGLAILLAVTGKSAQMPLYVWLPDAMAGPTPVSALIHAATMVTAGVYFMTRVSFLLVHSPVAMTAIATIGGVTALFAATIGFAQTDIKKVLAYSTVSQLGFMVLACGVGAFQFGIAHLMTHAFFKALLFLGAGSVIHAMHHEQDIRKMGGLMSKMPITGFTFVLGTLAIMGFPLFSGFMSKDEILYNSWTGPFGNPFYWWLGIMAAAGTAFYMTRLTWLVFFGPTRADRHTWDHVHENNWLITVPLIILGLLSVVGGAISVPAALWHAFGGHGPNFITGWLEPVLAPALQTMGVAEHDNVALEWGLMGVSVAIMFIMAGFAYSIYSQGFQKADRIAEKMGAFYELVRDKWLIDEIYQNALVTPLRALADVCFKVGDVIIIEGIVNGVPKGIATTTRLLSELHTGLARSYVKAMFAGVVLVGLIFLWSLS